MCHIQSLESRMLMSATAAQLTADDALIKTDAAVIRADEKAVMTSVATITKTVATDLKSSTTRDNRVTNAQLLTKVRVDEVRLFAAYQVNMIKLINPATALARRATADGILLMKRSTPARIALINKEAAELETITTAPLAKLLSDDHNTVLGTDLNSLLAANPTTTQLASDATSQKAVVDTNVAVFDTAAQKFSTDVGALGTDLMTLTA
jgi:hypothetical protein